MVNKNFTQGAALLPKQIPIAVDALADIKKTMERAAASKDQTLKLALMFARVSKALNDSVSETELLEQSVNEKAQQILNTHHVKTEELEGFDWDKGVILYKEGNSGS